MTLAEILAAPVSAVEAHPDPDEVAIVYVPAGAVARVYHPDGVREYEAPLPDHPWYAVVPSDKHLIGWGAVPCWYGSLVGVRNNHHRLDRKAWHAAANAVGEGVAYVRYELGEYYGKPRWTAVTSRVSLPVNGAAA